MTYFIASSSSRPDGHAVKRTTSHEIDRAQSLGSVVVAEDVLDVGDQFVVGEAAAVVEAGLADGPGWGGGEGGLDDGQYAVGEEGELAGLVEVDGGEGLLGCRHRGAGRRLGVGRGQGW